MDTYYTIVYRPTGSRIWTPWYGEHEQETQVWLSNLITVADKVDDLNHSGLTRFMYGTKETVPLQFAVAKVEVLV